MESSFVPVAAPGDRFLRIQEVESRVCLKKSAIYSRMSQGAFPRSVNLGRRCTVWLQSSIDNWIAEQVAMAFGSPNSAEEIKAKSRQEV